MNVTFVYRYLTLGGVEVVLRSRLHKLPAYGVQPTLWFLSDGPGRSLFAPDGQSVRIGGLADLGEHLSAGDVDVLSVIDTPEAFGAVGGVPRRPRVVLEVHTPYAENRAYLRSLLRGVADAVFVPSEHQKQIVLHEMYRPPEVVVVPNPIGEAFETPLGDLAPSAGPPAVAWVGRLDWLKNWRSFLNLAARVVRRMPDVEFWVVGGGAPDEEAEFERHCRRNGVISRLRWLRGQPHATMPRVYDAVRAGGGVLVSTSRGESFGMAVAEAMARGCAVVAPGAGPFTEFIADGIQGRLYRPGNESEAADAVIDVLTQSAERDRMGADAREAILRSHSTASAVLSLAGSLADVAGSPDGRGTGARSTRTRLPGTESRSLDGAPAGPGPTDPASTGGTTGQVPDRAELFSSYYASGFWPGPGSSVEYTARLRTELPALFHRLGIRSLLDAPCGDFGWFQLVERDPAMTYIGGDIIPGLVTANQQRFGDAHTRFEVIDITTGRLPEADLWLCRDCLFHFSNSDIFAALRNFARSEIRYLLTTTHPQCAQNTDIPTGSFRLLNLELPPFGFPEPAGRIDDWVEGHPVRQLALWDRASIARVLGSGPARP